MKRLVLGLVVAAFCNQGFCGGNEDIAARQEREKAELQKHAEKYRHHAAEMKNQKLSAGDDNAPEKVKQADAKAAQAKVEMAGILESLADAYQNADKDTINALQDQKWEKERDIEILDSQRKLASQINAIEEMQAKYPDSADLQVLKARTEANAAAYIDLLKAQNELSRKRKAMDKDGSRLWEEMDAIKRKIRESEKAASPEKAAKKEHPAK